MEHILLTSEHNSDTATHTTQRNFVQASDSKGYRAEYEIFNAHYVGVQIGKANKKTLDYTVDLTFLDPTPVRSRNIDWLFLNTALGLLAVTFLLYTYVQASAFPVLESPWFPLLILLGAGAFIAVLIGLHRSSDRILFYSRHGRAPLVDLLNNNPGKNEFQDFLQDLEQRIRQAQEGAYPNTREHLAAELREHRRLKDEAIISVEEYETVKRRILGSHESV